MQKKKLHNLGLTSLKARLSDLSKQSVYNLFERDGLLFAISATLVREIMNGQSVATVPLTPLWVAGMLSLRGEVLPVVLVDQWLGLDTVAYRSDRPIMVVQKGTLLMGFQVDAFHRVVSIPDKEAHPNPVATRNAYMMGIWHPEGQQLVTLLQGEMLLDSMLEEIEKEFGLFQVRS